MKSTFTYNNACRLQQSFAVVEMMKLGTLLLALWGGVPYIATAESLAQEQPGATVLSSTALQETKDEAPAPEKWAIHGQLTLLCHVTQADAVVSWHRN
jgi:hypothetical protein